MADIETELTCNICLELLNDPHQYACGHSFCLHCINSLRNRQSFACPDCRRDCSDSRDIVRNFRLKNVVEAYRSSGNAFTRNHGTNDQQPPNSGQQAGLQPGQEYGLIVVVSMLLFIAVYSVVQLQRTGELRQDVQKMPQITEPDLEIQSDESSASLPGVVSILLFPVRLLWMLVQGVLMSVWWLLSFCLWLIAQCVWLVLECIRLLFVTIWAMFIFICGVLIQSFNIFVYVCGLASIVLLTREFLTYREDV